MSRKNKTKNRQHRAMVSQPLRPTGAVEGSNLRPLRLTPIKIGIALGAVALGAALLLRPVLSGGGGNALTQGGSDMVSLGAVAGATTAPAASTPAPPKPVATGLPPPAPGTRVPINDADPFSGKPVSPGGPTVSHQGYVIGFCCAESNKPWGRLSETEKDTLVRKYLK